MTVFLRDMVRRIVRTTAGRKDQAVDGPGIKPGLLAMTGADGHRAPARPGARSEERIKAQGSMPVGIEQGARSGRPRSSV
jgi:hypothetical protein